MKRSWILTVCLFLTVATFIAFWGVTHSDFINYDDDVYVTENSHILDGVTMDGIKWAFTTSYAANWHPLAWISHMVDIQLFGLDPHRHHLVNLLFHIATALILFLSLCRMTTALWPSALVAALFALHPLHVESVAWVAERKDVLSALFLMLTLRAYVSYVERPGLARRVAVLVCFILGLMAKPMLVTLPFVLLLLDYWPFKRFMQPMPRAKRKLTTKRTATEQGGTYRWSLICPLLVEKIPFFVLAALSSMVTYIVQRQGEAVTSLQLIPLSLRITNACVSYMIYVRKMLWPTGLAMLYPYPGSWPAWEVLGAVLFLIGITSMVVSKAQRFPYLAVGWLWYIGTLVPVIGLVQVGPQAFADRYTYIPLIGLFIMTAWGIPELVKQCRYGKQALAVLLTLCLGCLFVVTRTQIVYWKNSISLYDHTIEVTDHNSIIHNDRGVAYSALGNRKQAIEDFDRAIEMNPRFAQAYYNRGNAYSSLGNYRRGIEDFDQAIEINPRYAEAYINRGAAHNVLGNYREGIEDSNKALEINPRSAEAFNNRGNAYDSLDNHTRAIEDYDRAIELKSKYVEAYTNRGAAYGSLGNRVRAIEDCVKAIEINPRYAQAYYNLAIAYDAIGNYRQAIEGFDRVIEIDPGFATARYHRGIDYYKLGDRTKAIEDLETAAQLGDRDATDLLRN